MNRSDAFWLEKALAVVGFLLFMGVFKSLLSGQSAARTDGSTLFQLIAASIYLAAIAALVARRVPVWIFEVLLRAWPLLLISFLPLVSTMWSQAPEATLRRAIALLLCSTFAVFLLTFSLRTIFNLLAVSFAIFLVINLAAVAAGGGIQEGDRYAGALKGIGGTKNDLGRSVGLGVALLSAAAMVGLTRRRLVSILILIALALLVLTRSATALAAAVAGIALGGMIYLTLGGRVGRLRVLPSLGIPLLVITAISSAMVVIFGWTTILEALGRDPTLTGRTRLWAWALQTNEGRQWLGSGYKAFWIDANTKYFFMNFWWHQIGGERSETFSGPNHAHSGYMDVYLEFGRVGAVLLGTLFLSTFINIRRALVFGRNDVALVLSVMTAFLFTYAVADKSLLQQSEDLWFLFVLLYLFGVKVQLESSRDTATQPIPRSAMSFAGARGAIGGPAVIGSTSARYILRPPAGGEGLQRWSPMIE